MEDSLENRQNQLFSPRKRQTSRQARNMSLSLSPPTRNRIPQRPLERIARRKTPDAAIVLFNAWKLYYESKYQDKNLKKNVAIKAIQFRKKHRPVDW